MAKIQQVTPKSSQPTVEQQQPVEQPPVQNTEQQPPTEPPKADEAPKADPTGKNEPDVSVTKNGNVIKWTVKNTGTLEIDCAKLPDSIRQRALMERIEAKCTDAAALSKKDKNGNEVTITPRQKFDAIKEVIERLKTGQWNKKQEGFDPIPNIRTAMVHLYKDRTPAAIDEWIGKQSKEDLLKLHELKEIKEALAAALAAQSPEAQKAAASILATF